jgi:hypothetical protein
VDYCLPGNFFYFHKNCAMTDNWITLLTFQHSAEAHLIRTKLESEGIGCYIQHEQISQIVPYVSEPAGPVKLQVARENIERAVGILKQSGYLKDERRAFRKSALIKGIELFTSRIPGLKNAPLQLRVILVVALVLVIVTLVFALATLPETP